MLCRSLEDRRAQPGETPVGGGVRAHVPDSRIRAVWRPFLSCRWASAPSSAPARSRSPPGSAISRAPACTSRRSGTPCSSARPSAPRCDEPLSTTQYTRAALAYGSLAITCATSRPNGSIPVLASIRPITLPRCTSQAARYCNAPSRSYSCSTRSSAPGPAGASRGSASVPGCWSSRPRPSRTRTRPAVRLPKFRPTGPAPRRLAEVRLPREDPLPVLPGLMASSASHLLTLFSYTSSSFPLLPPPLLLLSLSSSAFPFLCLLSQSSSFLPPPPQVLSPPARSSSTCISPRRPFAPLLDQLHRHV